MFANKTTLQKETSTSPADARQTDTPSIQAKLEVGSVNDPMEREADDTADRIMRMPDSFVQRKCAECEKEEHLQRKDKGGVSPAVSQGTDQAIMSSAGKGSPMDGATRSFMSRRMGHDFSDVNIHADGDAVQMSRELSARAFTVGRDIYFNEGEYQPGSYEGRHLLAHELTHTIQQGGDHGIVRKKDLEGTDKDALLEALHKNDAPIFLSRLRDWYPWAASDLLSDASFWQEVRSKFRGSALWSVFTILFFPKIEALRRPVMTLPQRQLSVALFNKKITDAMDALATIIARENIGDDLYWNVLEEVIFTVFDGDPKLQDIFRMIILRDSAASGPRPLDFSSHEVHYEKSAGTDAITSFGGSRRAIAYTTTNDLRAVVTIRLVNGDDPGNPAFEGKDAGIPDKWVSGIESVWNNRFELSNGINTKQFTVAPVFTYEGGQEDQTVQVFRDKKTKCPGLSDAGRENAACWFVHSDPKIIAHEFGHLLGANDEYNLPNTAAEIPAAKLATLSPTDLSLTTLSGLKGLDKSLGEVDASSCSDSKGSCVKGLMNDEEQSTQMHGRNILLLVAAFNAGLPPGVPPYVIKKK